MQLKKVTVIERFDLGTKTYAPGPAEVPADKVEKLLEKKLIASEDATEGSPQSGSTLEAEMLGALAPHALESESALETIARLASERDEARENLTTSVETITQGQKTNQDLIETNQGLLGQIREANERNLELIKKIGSSSSSIGATSPGVEKESSSLGNSSAPAVLLTAEELTKVLGSPKAAIAILEARLDTKDKLRAATDKELEALPDLAEGRIKKLRDYLAA